MFYWAKNKKELRLILHTFSSGKLLYTGHPSARHTSQYCYEIYTFCNLFLSFFPLQYTSYPYIKYLLFPMILSWTKVHTNIIFLSVPRPLPHPTAIVYKKNKKNELTAPDNGLFSGPRAASC